MLLGIRSKKKIFLRHLLIGSLSAVLVYLFYLSYPSWGVQVELWPDWNVDHAFWRSFAHAAFILLFLTLIIGPLAKLWPFFNRFVSWRRELGVWVAILSIGHAYAIWDRWALWDIQRFFGLEYVEALGGYAMFRPELGIMNMMAVVIFPMIILLALTSSDRAVNFLGISSWKWLHNSLVHTIFYTAVLRWVLYAFFFFQPTLPDLRMYPPIWFLYPLLGMALLVVVLQATAFIKTIVCQRNIGGTQKNGLQYIAFIGIGILFVLPIALTLGSVAFLDSRIITEEQMATTQTIPQNYANSFYIEIKDGSQNISLWARNLDTDPYFRQTVSVDGFVAAHQIFRNDERALYTAERGDNDSLAWSKNENVNPQDVGISNIIAGPAIWAAEYGVGEHQIQIEGGALPVSINSVEETIEDSIFAVPVDAFEPNSL